MTFSLTGTPAQYLNHRITDLTSLACLFDLDPPVSLANELLPTRFVLIQEIPFPHQPLGPILQALLAIFLYPQRESTQLSAKLWHMVMVAIGKIYPADYLAVQRLERSEALHSRQHERVFPAIHGSL